MHAGLLGVAFCLSIRLTVQVTRKKITRNKFISQVHKNVTGTQNNMYI